MAAHLEMTKSPAISLRSVTDGDREFLLGVHAASREIELAAVPWDDALKRSFVEHQFDAQLLHYKKEYAGVTHDVVNCDNEPAGRLFISRGDKNEIAILDITILPRFRKRGIATKIIEDLKNEAAASNRSLRIFVEVYNPSQGLFRNLGFQEADNDGVNIRFRWSGPASPIK